jgi:hypothetical protein
MPFQLNSGSLALSSLLTWFAIELDGRSVPTGKFVAGTVTVVRAERSFLSSTSNSGPDPKISSRLLIQTASLGKFVQFVAHLYCDLLYTQIPGRIGHAGLRWHFNHLGGIDGKMRGGRGRSPGESLHRIHRVRITLLAPSLHVE